VLQVATSWSPVISNWEPVRRERESKYPRTYRFSREENSGKYKQNLKWWVCPVYMSSNRARYRCCFFFFFFTLFNATSSSLIDIVRLDRVSCLFRGGTTDKSVRNDQSILFICINATCCVDYQNKLDDNSGSIWHVIIITKCEINAIV